MRRIIVITSLLQFILLPAGLWPSENQSSEFHAPYVVKVIDEESGLVSNRIKGILTDRQGFLWFVSNLGVSRFDGNQFTHFTSENTDLLSTSYFDEIVVDDLGRLLIISNMGEIIVRDRNSFFTLPADPQRPIKNVFGFSSDSASVWIGSKDGWISQFSGGREIARLSIPKEGPIWVRLRSLYCGEDGTFWIGTSHGLFEYGRSKDSLYIKKSYSTETFIGNFKKDSQGRLWVGTAHGVLTFDRNNVRFSFPQLEPLKDHNIAGITEDAEGNIWIATGEKQLYVFDGSQLHLFGPIKGLAEHAISSLHFSHSHIWVSTFTGGVFQISKKQISVIPIEHEKGSERALSIFRRKNGSYLIGTSRGLFTSERLEQFPWKEIPGLNGKIIHAVVEDSAGTIYAGTRFHGLFILRGKKITNYNVHNGLKVVFARTLMLDSDGTVWIGMNGAGIIKLKDETLSYIDTSDGLPKVLISFIHKSKRGEYWIGTTGGGLAVLSNDGRIRVYNTKNGLKKDLITGIYEAHPDTMWCSMNGGGIARISPGRIDVATAQDGISSNKILNMLYDSLGNFWCTADKGLFMVSRSDLERKFSDPSFRIRSRQFDIEDGLPTNSSTSLVRQSLYLTPEGILYITTPKGLSSINTKTVRAPSKDISAVITGCFINFVPKDDHKNLVLPPGTEFIDFNYTAVAFDKAKDIHYFYMLDGYDKGWIPAKSKTSALYSYLPRGTYTFKVYAENRSTHARSSVASLNLTILPFYWETVWFQSGAVVALIVFIFLSLRYAVRYRVRKGLRAMEAERALEMERTRIANDMHDEAGVLVTKIHLLSEMTKTYSGSPAKVNSTLDEIISTCSELVTSIDEIVWAVNPNNDRLDKMIYYVLQFAEELLSTKNIALEVSVPDDITATFVPSKIRHQIFLVIKEGMNNIVKHSKATKVDITISTDNTMIRIKVSDNGVGMVRNEQDQFQYGIAGMKKRIETLKGIFTIESREHAGTDLLISVDLSTAV